MPSREEKLKKAKQREHELVAEQKRIAQGLEHAPHKARKPLERARAIVSRLLGKVRDRIDQLRGGGKVAMFDSIDISQIPASAKAVAGYTSGNWPTYPELVKHWPHAHRLSIAVTSSHDADCLDVEPGDATPTDAAAWVRRQQQRGVKRPVLYCSLSGAQTLLETLARAGIPRSNVRLWTAHYTGKAHLCSPACGFGLKASADATQWTDHALGRNLDESLCNGQFFN